MQITFDPHSPDDLAIVNKIVGGKGTIKVTKTTTKRKHRKGDGEMTERVLALIKRGYRRPKRIRQKLNITGGTLGHHVRQLVKDGIITTHGATSNRIYRLA